MLKTEDESIVKFIIINNQKTSVEAIIDAAKDPRLRGRVAACERLPAQVLIDLSKDEAWQVRCGVANNPNTPIQILMKLVNDENMSVRCAVRQRHPEIDFDLLKKIDNLEDQMFNNENQ